MPGLRPRLLRAWSALRPYRPMEGGKRRLEDEYADGAWDYLAGMPELGRFSVLVGYCQHLHDRPSILEIGCGEGLLAERLCPARFKSYVGVDISETAISRARTKSIPSTTFVAADALNFQPTEAHDLILFTECLEYFDDPVALLQRFEASLTPNGFMIVSMFVGVDTNRTDKIWKMLARSYTCADETRVSNAQGLYWVIRVLQR